MTETCEPTVQPGVDIQKIRAENKMPPQAFEVPREKNVCDQDGFCAIIRQSTVEGVTPKKMACGEDALPEEKYVEPHPIIPVPRPAGSVELRGGKMLVGCTCLKRNGMQHDCQRKDCQGRKECLKFPAPVCLPSGLAPPVIVPSPTIMPEEPDCQPRDAVPISKTRQNQWKVLLNYARSQYQDNPPRPVKGEVPCKFHKKGLYYIRPRHKSVKVQTEIIE